MKDFRYTQYDDLNWASQESSHINGQLNQHLIDTIIAQKKNQDIRLYDIGFGIGFFFNMLMKRLPKHFSNIHLAGCEPSEKNYNHFQASALNTGEIEAEQADFLSTSAKQAFNFITAIYVFPHLTAAEVIASAQKIHTMLDEGGSFIMVVADEAYVDEKLKTKPHLVLDSTITTFKGKEYREILHYSEIPQIGAIIDYNRENGFYTDVFDNHGFHLQQLEAFEDHGFLCSIFTFIKKNTQL